MTLVYHVFGDVTTPSTFRVSSVFSQRVSYHTLRQFRQVYQHVHIQNVLYEHTIR